MGAWELNAASVCSAKPYGTLSAAQRHSEIPSNSLTNLASFSGLKDSKLAGASYAQRMLLAALHGDTKGGYSFFYNLKSGQQGTPTIFLGG